MLHQAQPALLILFLALGAGTRPRPRPRPRLHPATKALPLLQVWGDQGGVNPQGQVLHLRRWVQEGPGCV